MDFRSYDLFGKDFSLNRICNLQLFIVIFLRR